MLAAAKKLVLLSAILLPQVLSIDCRDDASCSSSEGGEQMLAFRSVSKLHDYDSKKKSGALSREEADELEDVSDTLDEAQVIIERRLQNQDGNELDELIQVSDQLDDAQEIIDVLLDQCIPACTNKACGADDGCGRPCRTGSCPSGEVCNDGVCECDPDCTNKACGDSDGCTGLCDGTCPNGGLCNSNFECECVPQCDNVDCGAADGCGGICQGSCPPGQNCNAGVCEAAGNSPVEYHGHLHTDGNRIKDEHGREVRLRGMALFWSQWIEGSIFYTREVIEWMRDDWKIDVVRATMAIEHGGYLDNPEHEKAKIEIVVQACIDLGVYVLIDWHDHNAEMHLTESQGFFSEMARKYGDKPHVLFETYNEPERQSWSGVIKPYHEAVIPFIREHSDNIIILGSRFWSQKVDEATNDPVAGTNLAYTLHFYASSPAHNPLREETERALAKGFPIFITEWGTCAAVKDHNDHNDWDNVAVWLDWMNRNGISDSNWAISDKDELCMTIKPGADPNGQGGWTAAQLTEGGNFMRENIRAACEWCG